MATPITTADELLRAGDIGRCEPVRRVLRGAVLPGFELPVREILAR
jgi:hypothetical protein